MSPRRSYDQYCPAARALDAVGDRWTLLIVRELLAGPRRYTDLHADLPGVSTDVLASRLRDMERDGLTTRRRLAPPGAAYVYELTRRGRELLPVLQALGEWGAPALEERRSTDAVRAHWFALPLLRRLEALGGDPGVVEVRLEEGEFHVRVGASESLSGTGKRRSDSADSGSADSPPYGEGPAPQTPDARLRLDAETCIAVSEGTLTLSDGVREGRVEVLGDSALAKWLREG
ncbi:winged helix-turn-helix transcriptional regulator [Streptomyces himalayensis]|uniref:Helix-turn-helix transcriptional regulator n=1 Tax=Streptomyces himalayensis subsp. himalayensis TaxID=2756131 RepID=A0A7W0DTV0_9ACTN|nr:helix-turn-helix domain-containing protein [Streptomyces himalayensis]MBA2951158.1 helix-turn-helix transcriptional regulator [Streptomyces himalayensis subsp. himalayensis]